MIGDMSVDGIGMATDVVEREDTDALTNTRWERRWGVLLQYLTSTLGSQEEGTKVMCG